MTCTQNPLLFEFDISKIDINKPIKSPDADYHPRKERKQYYLKNRWSRTFTTLGHLKKDLNH